MNIALHVLTSVHLYYAKSRMKPMHTS